MNIIIKRFGTISPGKHRKAQQDLARCNKVKLKVKDYLDNTCNNFQSNFEIITMRIRTENIRKIIGLRISFSTNQEAAQSKFRCGSYSNFSQLLLNEYTEQVQNRRFKSNFKRVTSRFRIKTS